MLAPLADSRGRPSPCRFLCIFVLAGECIEEWNGAAGLGRERLNFFPKRLTWEEMSRSDANTERCLAKPFFKRNGEAQSLCACPRVSRLRDTLPTQRAQIPAVLKRNCKTAGIAPLKIKIPIYCLFMNRILNFPSIACLTLSSSNFWSTPTNSARAFF